MDAPVGFPLSGNLQTPENPPPPVQPLPSTNGISLSQNAQSSVSPTNGPPAIFCNGPPAIFTPEEMHEELVEMNERIYRYLRAGRCRDYINGWYECMRRVVYDDENSQCCWWLAGNLRDCMFENYDYYQPILSYIRRRTHR